MAVTQTAPVTPRWGPSKPQQSLREFVLEMEQAGLLTRITEPMQVDDLPVVLEANASKGIFIEKLVDCEFSFLANAYSNHDHYAWALGCKKTEVGLKLGELGKGRIKPEIVASAPCKDVVRKGDDVDLTTLPLPFYHTRDGCAYSTDNCVVSADPDTGIMDWGVYRMMFRRKNESGIDLTIESHRCRIAAKKAAARGKNLPLAVVIGGPTLDKLACLTAAPDDVSDWDILGSFYGQPAQMIKCETNDLLVPANAELVLEGELMTSEGWTHDEGPFGEYHGMYGRGLHHNPRIVYHCMTYRKNPIFQLATVGGGQPWFTDNMIQLPAVEGDLFRGLKAAGIDVLEVRCPEGGLSQIAYAKIRTRAGGDAKQALAVMLTCSRQGLPKIAAVFDDDIDIWDDRRCLATMAFRFMPDRDVIIIPQCNTQGIDPSIGYDPPSYASKLGLDCTIPRVGDWDRDAFELSENWVAPKPTAALKPMTLAALIDDMTAFIKAAPRSFMDIKDRYVGQPYALVLQAFSALRPKLGRADDDPVYPYVFSDTNFAPATPYKEDAPQP
jgi:4-hydroxy-3-polyprenylbenzoate decarboxylase